MKSFNHKYTGTQSLRDFIKNLESQNEKISDILVTVYSGVIDMRVNKKVLDLILKELPNAKIIGCTTAGEIMDNEVLSEQIIISISLFEKTKIKIGFVQPGPNKKMVTQIAKDLISINTKGLLLFPIVFKDNIDVDGFVKRLFNSFPDIPVFGGGAGDNSSFKEQYNFIGNNISDNGIAAAVFNSDELRIETDYSFNWKPIGNVLKVTSIDKKTLHEIDHRPALEVFEEYLGKDAANDLPLSSLEFPMVFQDGDVLVARAIAGVEGESLILTAPVKNNTTFQFSFGVRKSAIEHANSLAAKIADKPIESIMAFSSIARLNFLQSAANKELINFHLISPVSGFFTYGEIFHSPGKNSYFLNEALTLAFFSENLQNIPSENKRIQIKEQSVLNNEERILKVLTHFSSKVTRQLETKNKELNNAYSILLDYNRIIDDKNFEIRKSLRYASSLQQIIMDNILDFSSAFDDYFLMFKPKDIVSGDFYFIKDLGNKVIIAVADGTGHGVPGAFISILGMRLMEEITNKIEKGEQNIDAAEFLNKLRDNMKLVFQRNTLNKFSSDGLDISIAIIDKEKQILNFASANQTGILYSKGEITQLKGDRMPIGVFVLEDDFTNLSLSYNKGDILFLFTDGYTDQFGGPRNKKINQARFRKLVSEHATKDIRSLEIAIDNYLDNWKGDQEQTDDILVMGVQF